MDKETWLKDSFSEQNTPDWPCPSCNKGLLVLDSDDFSFEETVLSKKWKVSDDWFPGDVQYRFHGTLKCQRCKDSITFLGNGKVDYIQYYDEYDHSLQEEYNRVFNPLYFNPPLKIFRINEKCPENIKGMIEDSFKLYWSDLSSCANKIRVSLELLMNQQKVKKTIIHTGKRINLSLHQRIEEYKIHQPEIANFLLAIKWIGNTGSHIGNLEKADILEAYELLSHSLNKLYDTTEAKLKTISKEIIKRKGARKRNK